MPKPDPTVIIGEMPLRGTADIERISSNDYRQLRQSRRWQGGDWEATFFVPGSGRYGLGLLSYWFQSWLMNRVTINAGDAMPWQGVIWEMTLVKDGAKRVVSVANVWNAIKTIYTSSTDSTQQETSFYTSTKSIERYGRREYIVYIDNVASAEAIAAAEKALAELSFPWPELTAVGASETPGLYIQAVGDIFTLNNQYATTTTSGEEDVSVFLSDTVTADSEFMTPGRIYANALQVQKEQRQPTRVWDLLLGLAELGDGSTPYQIWAEDGRVNYQPLDASPIYEWRGLVGGLQNTSGQPRLWDARPGVLRDYTIPSGTPPPGSSLTDARDSLIDEIQMWQGARAPQLRPSLLREEDLLQAKSNYERMIADQEEGE